MPTGLQRLSDVQLVGRRDTADDHAVVVRELTQLTDVVRQVVALEHSFFTDDVTDLPGDRPSGHRVVPRQHRQLDPRTPCCCKRIADAGSRWVVQPDQAERFELGLGLVSVRVRCDRRSGPAGDRQHPKSTLGKGIDRRMRFVADQTNAAWQHRIGRPLHHELFGCQHRLPSSTWIEGMPAEHRRMMDRRRPRAAQPMRERINRRLHRVADG